MLDIIRVNVSGIELPNINSKTSTNTSSQGYARLDNQPEDTEDSIMYPLQATETFKLDTSVKPTPHPCKISLAYSYIF